MDEHGDIEPFALDGTERRFLALGADCRPQRTEQRRTHEIRREHQAIPRRPQQIESGAC